MTAPARRTWDAFDQLLRLPGDLGPRAARRGRLSLKRRGALLRQRSWQIGQCAIAAALAWLLARTVLHHPAPFFAPVAAIVALGITYGQRLRRVAEITLGVALGVGVGDLFVRVVGTGVWQIAVIVAAAMVIAVLLDAGNLVVTQAGVQSVIVTTLLPNANAGLSRWLDAVVGGVVALVAAVVVPQAPLRRPRQLAGGVVRSLATLLRAAAASARDGDVQRAADVLDEARDTDRAMADLRAAAAEGLELVRSSPLQRRHRGPLRAVADIAEPLDRAVRNARVLIRRVTTANRQGERVPEPYLALLERLADATDLIASELEARRAPVRARPSLKAVAVESSALPRAAGLSSEVVLAQTRSMVVDLLQLTGLALPDALDLVPPMAWDTPS